MSFSFSQPQTYPGLAPNELLDLQTLRTAPQAAADVHQNRMLEAQTSQRNISAFDMEQAGRIAGSVLDETAYPTPEARAAAWPTLIARARANGAILPHAPDTYPGDDVMRSTFRMAMPAKDLFTTQQNQAGWGQITGDGRTAATDGGRTNAPPGTSTPAAPQNLADIHPDLTEFSLPSGVRATVAKSAAPQFQGLLTDLEAAGYKLDPDSTGGYNPRNIAGTNTPSQHAYGLAMDVNWQRNPRGANTPSDIPPDLARKLAAKWGLTWGGDWQGADRDPMHFEVARGSGPGTDHPKGTATGWNANNPLNLTADTGGVVTPGGARLASFGSMADGIAATAAKLQSYQTDRGLDTVRKMYTEWHKGSPVNDADMQRIAGAMGVGLDQPFQLDPEKTAAWITAAQPGETGTAGKRLSQADITAGVRQASAGPVAPAGGVAARTGGTDVAGPGVGTGGAPGGDLVGPRVLPPIGPGSPVVTPQSLANTPAPQPQAQVPQPPPNRAMPGGQDGPPQPAASVVAQQQPPAPVAAQPAAPAQPAAGGLLAGLSPDQVQAVLALRRSNGTPAQGLAMIEHFKEVNASAAHQTLEEQRQAASDAAAAAERTYQHTKDAETQRLAQEKAKRETEQFNRPFQGTGMDPQWQNILDKGDDGSAQYARAYTAAAAPKYNPQDGSWVKPNMTAYDKPTYIPKGMTEPPDYTKQEVPTPTIMTAPQTLAAGYADRMRNALPVISDTSDAAMNRWQVLLGKAPIVGNSLVSSEFQQHLQAERDFINAVLRRESGAAISEPEFINARQQYIPQPGDSKEVLAQKQKNRETVMANLVRDAGPAYKPPEASPPATKPLSNTKIKVDADGNIIQ